MEYADYVETGTMPPALPPDEGDEERKRKLIASTGGVSVMPPVPVRPSAATGTPTMPNSRGFNGAALAAASPRVDFDRQSSPRVDFDRSGRATADTDRARPERDAFGPDSQEFFQNALTSVRPSATPAQPSSGPSATATMPPVPTAAAPRSDAFSSPLSGRDKELALGATAQPKMPAVRPMETPAAPDLGGPKMPPVGLRVVPGAPARPSEIAGPEAEPIQSKMPPVPVGPEMQHYQDLTAKGEPKLSNWKKVLDVIGSIFPIGRAIETAIPGSPQNYDMKLMQAAVRAAKEQSLGKGEQEAENAREQARFSTPEKREAYMRQHPEQFEDMSDFEKNDWRVTGKFPQREATPKPENLDREAYDYYVSRGMSPADARKRVLQDAQDVKPERQTHTSPFEAFAYGSPEEKKAAQDYLEFEKRMGARYRNPNEFEERYKLFQEDPDTYKAMFGDKAGKPDVATATKMLNYFDRRRREINQDFTLDDAQKQEQLKDIENLEKPFMDVVQPGNRGGASERVEVIHPNGQRGTIPRSQLGAAKKKGYKLAGQQP